MVVKAYYDTAIGRWLFLDLDKEQKAAPQILPDEFVSKSLVKEEDGLLSRCRETRKQTQRIKSWVEENLVRQREEVERVPVKQQPKVQKLQPKLGERYRESSGHGVYSYVPSLREKTATLVRDVLNKKVSPQKMLLRLQWLTEEALNVPQ
ncbi:MAG: hypothetical protein QW175_05900 [Candidatus Bathyarchaeia archaeon]